MSSTADMKSLRVYEDSDEGLTNRAIHRVEQFERGTYEQHWYIGTSQCTSNLQSARRSLALSFICHLDQQTRGGDCIHLSEVSVVRGL